MYVDKIRYYQYHSTTSIPCSRYDETLDLDLNVDLERIEWGNMKKKGHVTITHCTQNSGLYQSQSSEREGKIFENEKQRQKLRSRMTIGSKRNIATSALVFSSNENDKEGDKESENSKEKGETVTLHWDYYGDLITVEAEIGKSLLEIAHENNIELEGACGGELACSTCHVIFSDEIYSILPEKEEEEEDMLDLAWGLTDTSRLGCQIIVTKALEGCTVQIPDDTNNMNL